MLCCSAPRPNRPWPSRAHQPAFVTENYPDDKAFDFKVGDLRGKDAVFIPELEQALAEAG